VLTDDGCDNETALESERMDLLLLLLFIIAVVGAVVGFDFLAMAFGVDSRPAIGDDHAWIGRL
jgi:hypothetical protein